MPAEIGSPPEGEAATKAAIFLSAERLFAAHGFRAVSVRDVTAAAGVNLAAVNYHFGSKDALLFEIFRRRTAELNRERVRMLHEADDRHGGDPPVQDILEALIAPPVRWSAPDSERNVAMQFIIRARTEGEGAIADVLRTDVTHLRRFADALIRACPALPPATVYWRLHFVLGMIHNNRMAEFDRLGSLSDGAAHPEDIEGLLREMIAFATSGFLAPA